jgi:hypothetical protein
MAVLLQAGDYELDVVPSEPGEPDGGVPPVQPDGGVPDGRVMLPRIPAGGVPEG